MRLLLEGAATWTLTANGFHVLNVRSSPDLLTILTADLLMLSC